MSCWKCENRICSKRNEFKTATLRALCVPFTFLTNNRVNVNHKRNQMRIFPSEPRSSRHSTLSLYVSVCLFEFAYVLCVFKANRNDDVLCDFSTSRTRPVCLRSFFVVRRWGWSFGETCVRQLARARRSRRLGGGCGGGVLVAAVVVGKTIIPRRVVFRSNSFRCVYRFRCLHRKTFAGTLALACQHFNTRHSTHGRGGLARDLEAGRVD